MKKYLLTLVTILSFSCFRGSGENIIAPANYINVERTSNGFQDYYKVNLQESAALRYPNFRWFILYIDDGAFVNDFRVEEPPPADTIYICGEEKDSCFVFCILDDGKGNKLVNEFVELEKTPYPSFDKSIAFITLSNIGDVFPLPGKLIDFKGPSENSFHAVYEYKGYYFYEFTESGYYLLDIEPTGRKPYQFDLFVSPVESLHTDRVDMDWYFTQFKTVTTSNCGPTVASMGIAWATGKSVSVPRVREILGWSGSGGVVFEELQEVLKLHEVESEVVPFGNAGQIFSYLDKDKLVGVIYNMAGVKYQKNPGENLFDQYYIDNGGHYLAIKGYSTDKKYFIIYDPIPSDWTLNAERYSDGISMYGRNRYYKVDEVLSSLRRQDLLIISRE